MRILDFKIYQYTLPISRPLTVYGKPLTQREGFILKLQSDEGSIGYGETAPLPGASLEMLEVVLTQLKDLRTKLMGQNIPPTIEKLGGKFSTWLEKTPLAPSVRFGFETAVLSLKANQSHKALAELLDVDYQNELPINRLLQGSRSEILKEAAALLKQGEQTLKLKVGNAKLNDDIATVNELTQLMAGRAILRLDANKAWTFDEALQFCKAVDYGAIEYIEEPLKEFSRIPELYNEVMIPLAVDESLKEHSLQEIKSLDGIEVIILKPMLIGGIEKTAQIANEAKSYGIRPVISSSFESGIGLRALANLAGCFAKHTAAGLDTAKWFERDLISPSLLLNHGKIKVDDSQLTDLQLTAEFIHEV